MSTPLLLGRCLAQMLLPRILNELYEDRGKLEATAELCYIRATDSQFHWKNIASQFGGCSRYLNGVDHSVIENKESIKPKKRRKARKIGSKT